MADKVKPVVRTLNVKVDIDQHKEGESWGGKQVASASLTIPLPANRQQVAESVTTLLDSIISQVTIFHGETVAAAKSDDEPTADIPF